MLGNSKLYTENKTYSLNVVIKGRFKFRWHCDRWLRDHHFRGGEICYFWMITVSTETQKICLLTPWSLTPYYVIQLFRGQNLSSALRTAQSCGQFVDFLIWSLINGLHRWRFTGGSSLPTAKKFNLRTAWVSNIIYTTFNRIWRSGWPNLRSTANNKIWARNLLIL